MLAPVMAVALAESGQVGNDGRIMALLATVTFFTATNFADVPILADLREEWGG